MPLFSILSVCQKLAFSSLLLLAGHTGMASAPTEVTHNDPTKPGTASSSPVNATVKGIDVSRWQKDINWELVKEEEIVFSFIKATEGDFRQDPYFTRNWSESKRNGIRRGAYHFFKPLAPVQCQIELFTNSVVLEPGDLPPVLDVEVSDPQVSPTQLRESIHTWLEAVTAHYGVKPIIYTSQNYYRRYLQGHFKGYHFWIARYSPIQPEVHHTDSWMFWQHTDKGRITGIKTAVDMNFFLGDVETLSQLCIPDLVASEEPSPLKQLKHMYPLP
ncbi:glycoside hydrolase family 25 protein [Pontibacter pamirensis]|uniref:glycoside hydrolase family 25 protein n=1 Tax=Pontibacter pamirensis TaxID=2562824 RepID=UPI00138A5B52|nr:GH25 family lysozyme [Pontibacter pamirensis]